MIWNFSLCDESGWRHFQRDVPDEIALAAKGRNDQITYLLTALDDPRIEGRVMVTEPQCP